MVDPFKEILHTLESLYKDANIDRAAVAEVAREFQVSEMTRK